MTKWTGIITLSFLAFLICWIWFPFFPSAELAFAMMGLSVALMTFYLMWRTKLVVGGGSYEYSEDDHIEAAITLFSLPMEGGFCDEAKPTEA